MEHTHTSLLLKVNKLILLGENLLKGSVEELPKNIVNFKMGIEVVKIALENGIDESKNSEFEKPLIKKETSKDPPVKKKRTRRTKVEMEAAKLAETKAGDLANTGSTESTAKLPLVEETPGHVILTESEDRYKKEMSALLDADANILPWKSGEEKGELEDDLKEITKVEEKLTEIENKFDKVLEESKTINADVTEDWEKEGDGYTTPISAEYEITKTINKYADPFNLALLTTRKEKLALIEDMLYIKQWVGNENSADIKAKVSELNLEQNIADRAIKFLTFLPHLSAQVK